MIHVVPLHEPANTAEEQEGCGEDKAAGSEHKHHASAALEVK